jgi:hypothetical protein
MVAFLAVLSLGVVLFLAGLVTGSGTYRGLGVLFGLMGAVFAAALVLRWLIYRRVG